MNVNFPKNEKRILNFWKKNLIFEKSILQRKNAKDFVFYEGPPTANGKPGIHHVLSRVFKDIICRYKTMQGFKVQRKAGWDTHGLPIELEIEKKLGLKNKKDIENYGIAKFNKKCKESVWQYLKDWEKLTERIGFWLDLKNPYITYQNEYIESVWFIIKEIHKRGLLYQGHKVVPYCPRCGTAISYHEVAQGYQRIKEPSIYVKFRIKNPEFENTSLLVWTTTPWTLPGNVAVAANSKLIYAKVKFNNENLILAKNKMEAAGLKDAEILEEMEGLKLSGIHYEAPYPVESREGVTLYKIIMADFVSLKEGTGLVHIAPAFGEEDMGAVKAQNSKLKAQNLPDFPILLPVDEEGKFRLEAKKWAGIFVKDADPLIIADLKNKGVLYKEELYEHDYPFCWRCRSPLLYYAKQSWFINMQEVKDDLIKNNQKINWVPQHLKDGRFGEWLKETRDWALSRERYWGTPLPVWKCKNCNSLEVIGSKEDLVSQKFSQSRILVLRHGESLKNIKNINVCWPEKIHSPLTKKGELEARKAAQKLKGEKIDLIISSDILRAKQTAEILAKELGLKVKFDKRLREINIGILNGKSMKECKAFWQGEEKLSPLECALKRFKVAPPKGENYAAVEKRLHKFISSTEKDYKGKNILIVSHQRPITLLEKVLYAWDLGKFADIISGNKEIKTGEIKEFEFKKLPYNGKTELDFHRPYIDEINFYCKKCGGMMERAPEVIDCWFDSGSMPFAQGHWLGGKPPELFPADYISEAIDQTRGWFYTLLAISTLLGYASPYKNVISAGHVLDEKGEKMSKSKGNITDPWYVVDKYGADAVRWYFYTINQPGEPKLFSEKDVDASLKKFLLTLWNCFVFLQTYKTNSKLKTPAFAKASAGRKNILDKWIISKINELSKNTADLLDKYDVTGAARAIEWFAIEDLSLWYIRRSRRRFQKPETKNEIKNASAVLGHVLFLLSKLMAPFVPFASEEIYQRLKGADFKKAASVHLEAWPEIDSKTIDKNLQEKMNRTREIVNLGLRERARLGLKVRQPLNEIIVGDLADGLEKEFKDLIREELNVKSFRHDTMLKDKVKLDEIITIELKEEGEIREIVRNIQEMRKKAKLKPKDRICVIYSGSPELTALLQKNEKIVLGEGKIKALRQGRDAKEVFLIENSIKVNGKDLKLAIKRN